MLPRRSFLGSGLLLLRPETVFGTQANSAIAFGVIGTGNRGAYVGSLMAKDPRARLAMLCDKYPEGIDHAKTVMPQAATTPATKDYRELLAKADIDAVLIATPVFLHPEHFAAAAAAKKHIYCEKPAGADVAGVQKLRKAAAAMDPSRSAFFGFQQRFSPEYLEAERMLKDGVAGDITLMTSSWVLGGAAFLPGSPVLPDKAEEMERKWGRWRASSGDIIVEQDCHGVDVMNWYAGALPLSAVGAGGNKWRSTGDNSDHVQVAFEYPKKITGWLQGSQLPVPGYRDVKERFFCTKGTLETAREGMSFTPPKGDAAKPVQRKSKRDITIDAVEAFFTSIEKNKPYNMANLACDSTLAAILGRQAAYRRREVTWAEMMKGNAR